MMTEKNKKIRLIIILVIVLLVTTLFLLCAIPIKIDWHKTVRCYEYWSEKTDFSLSDDTRLEDLLDFVEVKCDFTVYRTLTYTIIKKGSVKLHDREYEVDAHRYNFDHDNHGIRVALHKNSSISRDDMISDDVFISNNGKYIEITVRNYEGKHAFNGIGGCETLGELRDAFKAFQIPWDFTK